MGQKVHPHGYRLGITTDWNSKWYASAQEFPKFLLEDIKVRDYLKATLKHASVSRILIERPTKEAVVTVYSARPGIVIGKKGEDIDKYRNKISLIMGLPKNKIKLNVKEIRKPELDAHLVAEGIAQQLERRIMYRRAMKRAVTNTMRLGALGIKVNLGGRLNGAEIARSEWYREGQVPLHTLKANIDYGVAEAMTTYGIIGIKVWINHADDLDNTKESHKKINKNIVSGI